MILQLRELLATALFASVAAMPLAASDWPQWRGPNRDDVSAEKGLLQQWPTGGPTLAWKTSGLGAGFFAREGKRTVGYAFASIRRKSNFIAPLHLVRGCDEQPVANRLLSLCAEWLESRGDGGTLAMIEFRQLRW